MCDPDPTTVDAPPRSQAWDRVLLLLGGSDQTRSDAFVSLRRRLIRFFEWRGCDVAEDLADETLERLARKLAAGEDVVHVSKYAIGIARHVALESAKRRRRQDELRDDDAQEVPASSSIEDRESQARRVQALEECLKHLDGADRSLLLDYFDGAGAARIAKRKALASERALEAGALRLRVHRFRASVERCVKAAMTRVAPSRAGAPSAAVEDRR